MTARIVFGMSEAEYHKYPAFSSSGVRDILVSPLTFWTKSWMNPNREDDDTDAKDYGTAFHKLMLEGREVFDKVYAVAITAADYPDHLDTANELKGECKRLGIKPLTGTKAELAARILEKEPEAKILYRVEQEHLAACSGKKIISKKWMDRLNLAKRAWDQNPEAALLKGGISELSVFWTEEVIDEVTGEITFVECKSRIDKLQYAGAMIDLKSFSNSKNKRLEQAVGDSFANYRYGIPGFMYLRGLETLNEAETIEIWGDARCTEEELRKWLGPKPSFTFVFQESGNVPNIVIRDFLALNEFGPNMYFEKARMDYEHALRTFARCRERYGDAPWVEPLPRAAFHDDDFPAYALA